MPTVKVFYSWQSIRSEKYHRRLIRDAASDACKRITLYRSNDFKVVLEDAPVVVPGMCDLPNSILRKIDECDLLLADLTYVATSDEVDRETGCVRQCSDPAVLLQLGYAAHVKGVSRLVGVKNEVFGGPGDLLLDARRRWIVAYSLQPGPAGKRAFLHERKTLSRKLEGVLLTAMHEQEETDRKLPTNEQFLEARAKFEAKVVSGAFPRIEADLAAVAITLVPAEPTKLEPDDLAAALNSTEMHFEELKTGEKSVTGFTGETTVDVTSTGLLRAASTNNLNAQRAGFPLPPNAAGMIPSNTLERNIIRSVYWYCRLLQQLEVPLPWQLGISLLGIREFTMVVGAGERSDVFDGQELSTDPLIIREYETVAAAENVARLLKGTFDCIWREFGLGYSRNYDVEGNWNREIMV